PLATRRLCSAYSLAAMSLEVPRVRPLWQVPVSGTPVQAITPLGNRLLVTVASADWREVHAIEHRRAQLLHAAPKVSWIAADNETSGGVFLSEDGGRVQLDGVDEQLTRHSTALRGIGEHSRAVRRGASRR